MSVRNTSGLTTWVFPESVQVVEWCCRHSCKITELCVYKRDWALMWTDNRILLQCVHGLSLPLSIYLHIPELFLTRLSRNLERKWWIFHMQNELRSMRKQDNKKTVSFHKSTKYPHLFYALMGGSAYQNHDGLHTVIIQPTWLIFNSASSHVSFDMKFRNNSRKKAISTWWNELLQLWEWRERVYVDETLKRQTV